MPESLNKLLNKTSINVLIKEFFAASSNMSAFWFLDDEGKCITFYPKTLDKNEIKAVAERIRQFRDVTIENNFIISPFCTENYFKGFLIFKTNTPSINNSEKKQIKLFQSIFREFLLNELEKRDVVKDALNKYREITLLYTIGDAIGSCMQLDQLLELIMKTNRKVIKADRSILMLLNSKGKGLEVKAIDCQDTKKKVFFHEEMKLAYDVLKSEKPQFFNVANNNAGLLQKKENVKSLLCAPLKVNEKIIGVICITNKERGEIFTSHDEKFLMTLASQSAIAIENSNLISRLKERNRKLKAALKKVELLEKVKNHLSKFVPMSVKKIVSKDPHHPKLEKQHKDVSVLFLDISGYSKVTEILGHEKINFLIEKYFSVFLDDIHKNDGDINETAGDGLMVIFQNSDMNKNAFQAAKTALAIRDKTNEININLRGEHSPILVNIGINSGVVSLGSIKLEGITGTRWTYTATGNVTNLAARISSFAKNGSIFVSEETYRRISEKFIFADGGEQKFKNITKPIRVFCLLNSK